MIHNLVVGLGGSMKEQWQEIINFENYSVSNFGRVRSDLSNRILTQYANQSGLVLVGLMYYGIQHKRSVPLLVSRAFIPQPSDLFDTPINLDGDRFNNHADNLVWRPRWFAVKFNRQFAVPYENSIKFPIEDIESGEVVDNSLECAKRYGLLESEIVISIIEHTYVWPTYQQFRVIRS